VELPRFVSLEECPDIRTRLLGLTAASRRRDRDGFEVGRAGRQWGDRTFE